MCSFLNYKTAKAMSLQFVFCILQSAKIIEENVFSHLFSTGL